MRIFSFRQSSGPLGDAFAARDGGVLVTAGWTSVGRVRRMSFIGARGMNARASA
jgi:hypothetical protein